MDEPTWVDSHEVSVVCDVVDRAKGDAIDDGREAFRIGVPDDVRGLDQRGLPEGADGAPLTVGVEHIATELSLVVAAPDHRECVLARVFLRDDSLAACIHERQAHLEHDHC